jgi:CRISPR-associated protein Csd1
MSWMNRLIETYDRCKDNPGVVGSENLLPIAHISQRAQIEIVLDGKGNFRRASVLAKTDQRTIMPCTEKSACRTAGPVPHPLCDNLKYVARDFSDTVSDIHQEYITTLAAWTKRSRHPKLAAVLKYVQKGTVIADLVANKILFTDSDGKLLEKWVGKDPPQIFKELMSGNQMDALVRWRVEHDNDFASGTWEDESLKRAWIDYYQSLESVSGLCMSSGKIVSLATKHPKKIRNAGDGAKLISSNDKNGYTFRGRFTTPEEALTIGFEATQKAHSALRWLISRQSFYHDSQVIVSWATSGTETPDPCSDSTIFGTEEIIDTATDVGQAFARRLNKAIAGYKSNISDNDCIVIMMVDSATTGRLAIPYYRELRGSEFLDRLTSWHLRYSWLQNFGKDTKFFGAPSPKDIAEAAYGQRLDDKLKKLTIERLLPCIIDGAVFPVDLIISILHRVSNRVCLDSWEFNKCLGIICALYRGANYQRKYEMKLEENRRSRDYLFGRLLATAEKIEKQSIFISKEKSRPTTAERLTQRFVNHPSSTWKDIHLALVPYKARLTTKSGGFLHNMEKLLEEIVTSFEGDDFVNDNKLSAEYLLGYYCQRAVLWSKKDDVESEESLVET